MSTDFHMALGMKESREANAPSLFETWASRVEIMIGRSLDRDQIQGGFSLDFAYESFRSGETANEYAATICARTGISFLPLPGDAPAEMGGR
jgi:hypothetical protein